MFKRKKEGDFNKDFEEELKKILVENNKLKIENETLKKEIEKLSKELLIKKRLENLDKTPLLIFHPLKTYQELLRTERPDVAEEMALYFYNEKLLKFKKYSEEILHFLSKAIVYLLILAILVVLVVTGVYFLTKLNPVVIEKPVIITQNQTIQKSNNVNNPNSVTIPPEKVLPQKS